MIGSSYSKCKTLKLKELNVNSYPCYIPTQSGGLGYEIWSKLLLYYVHDMCLICRSRHPHMSTINICKFLSFEIGMHVCINFQYIYIYILHLAHDSLYKTCPYRSESTLE